MAQHRDTSADDTDKIKNLITIKDELDIAIANHEEECKIKNDMTYIKNPNLFVQISVIVSLCVATASAIGWYWKIESEQNQKSTIMEIKIDQQQEETAILKSALNTLIAKQDENQKEIINELKKIRR